MVEELNKTIVLLLWLTIAVYAFARVLQVYPGRFSMLIIVALHVFPSAIFAFIHGSLVYRVRDAAIFTGLCAVIGNLVENIGVVTGFPFGHYYFTDVMGPKIFHVNVMLGLAYIGMGYLSWTMATIIVGSLPGPQSRSEVWAVPLLAAFIMVAWDLAMDPVWSTIKHAWIWQDGGPYFGVPLSNFLGWFATVYLIYQSFAFYLWRFTKTSCPPVRLRRIYLWLPILFYAVSAAGNLLLLLPSAEPPVVRDTAGAQWNVNDITTACVLVSIFTMGAFVVLGSIRLVQQNQARVQDHPGTESEPHAIQDTLAAGS